MSWQGAPYQRVAAWKQDKAMRVARVKAEGGTGYYHVMSRVIKGRKARRRGISQERVQQVVEENGKLSLGEVLQCRVRYFTDGVALESKEFVNEVFAKHRSLFSPKPKSGARV